MTSQIRRASTSIHLNIAEGGSRLSEKERSRFYEMARGSLIEVDTALPIATELGYTRQEDLSELGQLILRCFQMLSKMIKKSYTSQGS